MRLKNNSFDTDMPIWMMWSKIKNQEKSKSFRFAVLIADFIPIHTFDNSVE